MKEQCIRATKDIKQILIEQRGKIDSNTMIAEDFNTPLPTMDRSSRPKINKKTVT